MTTGTNNTSSREPGHPAERASRACLLLILAAVLVLRIALVARGGQFFVPDEIRYLRALQFANHLVHGRIPDAFDILAIRPDHNGFTVITLPASLAQGAVKKITGADFGGTYWITALYVALWAMACVGAVHRLARTLGAGPWEAVLAAALLACSSTFHLYASHLLPYDISLALGLLAVALSASRANSVLKDMLSGILGSMAFLVYNGNWQLAGLAFVSHVFFALKQKNKAMARCASWIGGALLLPVALYAYSLARQIDVVENYLNTVRVQSAGLHGDFGEGWMIPWLYFWTAEHFLLVFWVFFALVPLAIRREPLPLRSLYCLCVAGISYALMIAVCDGLKVVVIYGRLARQIVPFLCIASAYGCTTLCPRSHTRRIGVAAVCAFLIVQAGINMAPLIRQKFPLEILIQAMARYDNLSVDLSVEGPQLHVDENLRGPSRYVLVNHRFLYPIEGLKPVPEGRVLLSTPHPLDYRPNWYDGYMRRERDVLEKADLNVKLVDTQAE